MDYKVLKSTLLLICITQTTGQFFDFFSALQPVIQHPAQSRYQYDVTTKRIRTQTQTQTPKRNHAISFNTDEAERDKTRRLKAQADTRTSHRNNNYSSDRPKTTLRPAQNTRTTQKPRRKSTVKSSHDAIYFNNDRNTINNKYTDFTTHNPFLNGVRPAVANGPPITNKPPTHAPQFFEDASPELIIGPDEDYMSEIEKLRYIEVAERMCDKYKALDVKQLQAIPLVPSPRPVRVNVSSCVPSEVPLVVGGKVVSVREFPHMALLGWPKSVSGGYAWKCGGSLLSDRYVLTAAHCAYQDKDNSVVTGPPRAVQLGSSYLNDPGALVIKVASVTRHPKYKLPKSYFDLALVKLEKAVSFSEVIRPACLGRPPSPGKPIIATGWGRTEFRGDQSLELRSVSIPVWEISQCRQVLGTSRKLPEGPLSDSQICAGEVQGGKDTCQGDSGGPAQIQDGCIWRVVAVTSLGRACGAPNTPALYAKVHPVFVASIVFNGETIKRESSTNQNQNHNQDSGIYNRRETTTARYNNNQQNYNFGSGNNYNQHDYSNQNRGQSVSTTTISNYGSNYNNRNKAGSNRSSGNGSNNNRQNNNYGSTDNGQSHNHYDSGYYNGENDGKKNYETSNSNTGNYNTQKQDTISYKPDYNHYNTDSNKRQQGYPNDYNQEYYSNGYYNQNNQNQNQNNYNRYTTEGYNNYESRPYDGDTRQVDDGRIWWT
ncbi:uncharacterized protein LOC119838543 [Zerene cesonia]|uniref:uncharacterized protein LOC119838543 n=1 Tax=Zerene cesonia TaxID=33412 RepID=UPI0018E52DBD|nr:uncharacterized protein LOC119838543 [Zerene cesonia]